MEAAMEITATSLRNSALEVGKNPGDGSRDEEWDLGAVEVEGEYAGGNGEVRVFEGFTLTVGVTGVDDLRVRGLEAIESFERPCKLKALLHLWFLVVLGIGKKMWFYF